MFKSLLIATALVSSVSVFAKVEKVEVDPTTSKVVWLGKKVTGEHSGEIKISSGNLNFDGAVLKGGEFVIDTTTISNTDLTDPEYNKKLVGHLQSEDFFSTEKFKTAKLVIKSASKVKGDTYKLSGDLTIKGKSAPVTFNADVTKASATGVLTFDRTKYDIKYGSGKFFQGLGDKLINDDVQLTINLIAKK